MNCRIQCQCGKVQGEIERVDSSHHGVCYCKDCQAFAHFLGARSAILDEHGGTEVIQTSPQMVNFTSGIESVACMRLTETGLLRWYASCCQTPIGNTPADYKMSFVGFIRVCLQAPGDTQLDDVLGPIRTRYKSEHAMGDPPKDRGVVSMVAKFAFLMARSRLTGAYKNSPFFSDAGVSIATPKVLTSAEHEELYRLV